MTASARDAFAAKTLERLPLTARRILARHGTEAVQRAYLARNPASAWLALPGECVDQAMPDLGDQQDVDVFVLGELAECGDALELLKALRARARAGAVCIFHLANPAHWSRLANIIRDGNDSAVVASAPPLDLAAAESLVTRSGWSVRSVEAVLTTSSETEGLAILLDAAAQLGVNSDTAKQRLEPSGWVVRATWPAVAEPISLVAMGLKGFAGVTEARVHHPWTALASRPGVAASWDEGSVVLPKGPPGVLTLHRQFLTGPLIGVVDRLIAAGWTIVSDMDDDPHHWPQFVSSNFRAYRGVHAVSVSTDALAEMVRQWNPNVRVFPNAILDLPEVVPASPKSAGNLRIFFGALNRGADWAPIMPGIVEALEILGDRLEVEVLHDRAFAEALPRSSRVNFQPTVDHRRYMQTLATCDIALLPLADTPFNRLKSDLKLIECCAAGAVPICSPTVYLREPGHREVAEFADSSADWRQAILALASNPDELRKKRERGLTYVRSSRMHAQQASAREQWSRELAADRPELERQRLERLRAAGLINQRGNR